MRGYFAFGAENISKPMNLGNLIRSAHAFGASFFFTIAPKFEAREVRLSDTSDAAKHLPLYTYDAADELALPRGCALIGVELSDDAVELPSFPHPNAAAYVFGPERGELSPELQARCQKLIKIPCLSGLHPHPLGLEWARTGYRGARHGCSRPRRSPIPAFATRVPATFPR